VKHVRCKCGNLLSMRDEWGMHYLKVPMKANIAYPFGKIICTKCGSVYIVNPWTEPSEVCHTYTEKEGKSEAMGGCVDGGDSVSGLQPGTPDRSGD